MEKCRDPDAKHQLHRNRGYGENDRDPQRVPELGAGEHALIIIEPDEAEIIRRGERII